MIWPDRAVAGGGGGADDILSIKADTKKKDEAKKADPKKKDTGKEEE
jgi:hypothetical protein